MEENEMENKSEVSLKSKINILSNYLENESVDQLSTYIQNELSEEEIINLRFSGTKKTLLIRLVVMESNAFEKLFSILKGKISKANYDIFINLADDDGNTPLLYATFKGKYEIVECLIRNGAKIDMRNFMGLSVMHMAAEGDRPNMLIYFRDKYNFNINDRDYAGNTPLHWACHMAAENSINFLLSWIVDVNLLDKKCQTPLHLGIYTLRPKLIKKLLYKGANIHLKDCNGHSVMDLLNDPKIKVKNFKLVLRVIQNSEPFKLCVYPNSNKSKSNDYKELLESFKGNDIKERLLDNDKDEERKRNSLTLSRVFNIILFLGLHICAELLIFFCLLPQLNSTLSYNCFFLLIIILVVSFFAASKSNPGQLEPTDNLTWLQMVEAKIRINEYCPYCRVKKVPGVKHCHVCKKCISGFDHHCNWIDNCVGDNNIGIFVVFVMTVLLNLFFSFYVSILSLKIKGFSSLVKNIQKKKGRKLYIKSVEDVLDMGWILDYEIDDLVAILIIMMALFFFVPVFYVLWIQIKNRVIGVRSSEQQ